MKFPFLRENQFAIIMADSRTGNVLNSNFELYRDDIESQVYIIFDEIESAREFIKDVSITHNVIEFVIYNHKQEVVDFIPDPH